MDDASQNTIAPRLQSGSPVCGSLFDCMGLKWPHWICVKKAPAKLE